MNALLERMKGDPIKDILEASYMNNQQQESREIELFSQGPKFTRLSN